MSSPSVKNVIRQRPRLLYAGIDNTSAGWRSQSSESGNAEFVLITGGSGKAEAEGEEYPFKAGDFIIYNRGCAHREFMDVTEGRELLFVGVGNLHIHGLEPDTLLSGRNFCIIPTESYFPALRGYMSELVAETEGLQPMREEISAHLLKIILLFAVRLVGFNREDTFSRNLGYLEAKKYFDEHFLDIDSIDNVCKSLVINKYYLTHIFSQNAGMPPMRYLITKRIELACQYLETSDDDVADIGKRCGYVDPCYFSRMFRKVKGVTPLRYRYLFKLEKAGKTEEDD